MGRPDFRTSANAILVTTTVIPNYFKLPLKRATFLLSFSFKSQFQIMQIIILYIINFSHHLIKANK
jgi:hypothetical protein